MQAMITERLLQYIWESASFDVRNLETVQGQTLQIMQRGTWNKNQGPDFLLASIRIDGTILVGNIEMHLRSSDWYRHAHDKDSQYRNVVLHVVWEYEERNPDIPTLELKDRVAGMLLGHYEKLMSQTTVIACAGMLPLVGDDTWKAWKETLLHRRLMTKANYICSLLQGNKSDWEEVNWWMMARAFGLPVNGDAFEQVARSVSLKILIRESHQPKRMEALLMGQAGMLSGNFKDQYPGELQQLYEFLKSKYRLKQPPLQMKLLRMRPASFPGIRLSQLVQLVPREQGLLKNFRETETLEELLELVACSASKYWNDHYRFDETTTYSPKKMGRQLFESLVLNAIAPMVFSYGAVHSNHLLRHKAGRWLWGLKPERNHRIDYWENLGVAMDSAADTQALLELTNHYCTARRCLECDVAKKLLEKGE